MLLTECRLQASGELFGFQSLLGFQITGEHMTMRASLVAQMVKNLSAVRETWVPSLGQEDPLEKRMYTPVFLPGKFHFLEQRSLAGYSLWGCKESDMTE